MNIELALSQFLLKHKPIRLYVAVSGGVDSMVLLDAISKYKRDYFIEVLHVNHHLAGESDKWQALVKQKAFELGIPFKSFNVHIETQSAIEEQCRDARYQVMASYINNKGLLLTAHHQEDQRETSLFRFLRGSSLRGLIGMQEISQLFGLQVGRPFLQATKKSILEYANAKQLAWVEDPSNHSDVHTRNRIRRLLEGIHDIQGYKTTQMHLSRQQILLEESVQEKLMAVKTGGGLSICKLSQLSHMWQEEVLYYWLSSHVGSISHSCMPNILDMMVSAKEDRYPSYKLGHYQLLRYRDILSVMIIPALPNPYEGRGAEIDIKIGVIQNISGERVAISYLGDDTSQYKKLFQKWGVPNWLRAFMPITNQLVKIRLNASLKDYEEAFNGAFKEINTL